MAIISFAVFFLVITSSVFHALWNFFARKVKGNMGVIYIGLFVATIALSPFILFINIAQPSFIYSPYNPKAAIFILISGLIHVVYFACLGAAYKFGEISVVYPVARGTGVGLTSLVAYFILGERVDWLGWIGIWSIVIGVMMVGLGTHVQNWIVARRSYSRIDLELKDSNSESTTLPVEDGETQVQVETDNVPVPTEVDIVEPTLEPPTEITPKNNILKTFLLAVSVGVTISVYSVSDKLGVSLMDRVSYIFFFYLATAIIITPYIMWRHREETKEAFLNLKKYSVFVGIVSCGAYLAILFAFQLVPASYIVAMREVSVVIGSLLGFFILREKVTVTKIIGILLIVCGLVFVKLA